MPFSARFAAFAVTLALSLLLSPAASRAQAANGNTSAPAAPNAPNAPVSEPAMTLDRLDMILRTLDPDAQGDGRVWRLRIDGVALLVITDKTADRMRAIAPVRDAAGLDEAALRRMMQANFDSALDARYAIAHDVLWAAFIHPLGALEKNELISGLGQVVNLVHTYGTLYSGGALIFGGGDSGALQRRLIDELLKKGEDI